MKNGLTQEQLAEKIDIAPRTLSGIETGENFLQIHWEKFLMFLMFQAPNFLQQTTSSPKNT